MKDTGSMKHSLLMIFCLLTISGCSPLGSIPNTPAITPEEWLMIQPFVTLSIGATDIILVQPSSTVFVYALGLVAIGAGLYALCIRAGQGSRAWWGIALLLWGLGALFAGTSYQAFSYEIKCAGRVFCSWTSWWEVIYLILSAASVDAMVIAVATSSCQGNLRKGLSIYAWLNSLIYALVVLVGAFTLKKFLISFELLLLVAAPSIIGLTILNGWRFLKVRKRLDLALLGTWVGLGIVLAGYYLYLTLDIAPRLWERGIWFSENDLLHIGLIGWMISIGLNVIHRSVDLPNIIQVD
jgi:hypothetical protein